jgi:2-polyprenyl-6-methoxyphenol hydroxylase-like FAD-dependent oxidoreductase
MQPDAAQNLLDQSEPAFAVQLARAFEYALGDVLEVRGRFVFPLRQRHAQTYQRGRVVLIGDAAHTIHPLAGQGVNLGFMDVCVLAEEIQRACEKNLSPSRCECIAALSTASARCQHHHDGHDGVIQTIICPTRSACALAAQYRYERH